MFYCDKCADKYGYPETWFKSHGKCETCDEVAVCNDTPSKFLPMPLRADGTRAPDPYADV